MLEMLLDEVSEEISTDNTKQAPSTSQPPVSLGQIINSSDPLDDILSHLTGNDKKATPDPFPPMPNKQIDTIAPSARVDTNYLELLSDILVNSGSDNVQVPYQGIADDVFMNILSDVLQQREKIEATASDKIAMPVMPSLSEFEKPNLAPTEPSPATESSRLTPAASSPAATSLSGINYLDLLDDMMATQESVKPTAAAGPPPPSALAKPSSVPNEGALDKAIRSQDGKLAQLMNEFRGSAPQESKGELSTFLLS